MPRAAASGYDGRMTTSATVTAGAQAPERLTLRVEAAPADTEPLDLSTVIGVDLEVRKPDGSKAVWAADILQQDPTHLLLEHEFAITDIWEPGLYQLSVKLAVPDGVRRAGPGVLQVVS